MKNHAEPLISTRKLCRVSRPGEFWSSPLADVDLDVYPEEILTVVGESGSGKSALARVLLGLDLPSSGQLLFKGKPVTDRRGYWRHVQTVFQDPMTAFNQFFSVRTQLLNSFHLFSEKMDLPRKISLIENALESVNLDPDEVLEKYHFQLSSGQLERLMLARIVLIRPKVLIADEPTSRIDACSRISMLDLLLDFKASLQMSIVFFTHDIGLAQYVSDRLCIMSAGTIVENGCPDSIIANPQHHYTRRLLDDIPLLSREWLRRS